MANNEVLTQLKRQLKQHIHYTEHQKNNNNAQKRVDTWGLDGKISCRIALLLPSMSNPVLEGYMSSFLVRLYELERD